jgi:hypothetical protein
MAVIKNGEPVMADITHIELLDWFAGQALAGILASSHFPTQGSGEPFGQFAAKVTDLAFGIADAMMKQSRRLKKEATAAW